MDEFHKLSHQAQHITRLIVEANPVWLDKFGLTALQSSHDTGWTSSVVARLDPAVDWIDAIVEVIYFFESIDSILGFVCNDLMKTYLRQFSVEILLSIEAKTHDEPVEFVSIEALIVLVEKALVESQSREAIPPLATLIDRKRSQGYDIGDLAQLLVLIFHSVAKHPDISGDVRLVHELILDVSSRFPDIREDIEQMMNSL